MSLSAVQDDCGRQLVPPARPERIICLCPSLTETLYALGLGARVVGRTRYCIHPQPEVAQAEIVGGTKQMDFAAISALKPDLIIAEKEENRQQDVESLSAIAPVYVFDIQSVDQAVSAITQLGALCKATPLARRLATDIQRAWDGLEQVSAETDLIYMIWRKPWMAAGQSTYIDSVLSRLGFTNLACQWSGRYPSIEIEQIQEAKPQLCFLSSEPYPFANKHLQELQAYLPETRLQLVDGEMFSWYGARMLPAAAYLQQLLQQF